MWKSEEWEQFLKVECQNYPKDTIVEDAKFLGDQHIEPSQFDDLIKMSESASPIFNGHFQSLSIGNLIRFINGLKAYVHQKASKKKMMEAEDESIPRKQMCQSYDVSILNPRYSSWYKGIIQFMFYLIRKDDQENRRCITAFAPTFAATYAHEGNSTLYPAVRQDGKIIRAGSTFKVYSFDTDGNGKSKKEINVQVIVKNEFQDFIILEALDGATFFDVEKTNILKTPSIGDKFLCLGLSSSNEPHPIEGIVMTSKIIPTKFQKKGFVLADCIVWGGDSGGGVFSTDNQLLGIVSGKFGENRTVFVPADILAICWEEWKHPPSSFHSVPERME